MDSVVINAMEQVSEKFHMPLRDLYSFLEKVLPFSLPDQVVTGGGQGAFDAGLDQERRRQTGSYYTPPQIAKDLVSKALKAHKGQPGKVIDLAMGDGALLAAYMDLTCTRDEERLLCLEQLYGGDIHKEPIVVALCHLLMQFDIFPALERVHFYHGNSLLATWPRDFSLVIGNPPYVGEKNNRALFHPVKESPLGRYYEGKMDYFYFFFYKAYDLVAEDGIIAMLTTSYYVTADGAKGFRRFLQEKLSFEELSYYGKSIFAAAKGQHNMISILSKKDLSKVTIEYEGHQLTIPKDHLFDHMGKIKLMPTALDYGISQKMDQVYYEPLGDHFEVNQGIVSGLDRSKEGGPVFVFSTAERKASGFQEDPHWKPFYKNSDIRHEELLGTDKWIYYLAGSQPSHKALLHFKKHEDHLKGRREVKNGVRAFYELTWPRKASIFEEEKIVLPQRAEGFRFYHGQEPLYGSADIYYIRPKSNLTLSCLAAYFRLPIVAYWLYMRGKRKGNMLELYASPLKEIPLFKQLMANDLPSSMDEVARLLNLSPAEQARIEDIGGKLYET